MKRNILAQPDKSVSQVYHEVLGQSVSTLRADRAIEEISVALPTLANVKSSLHSVRAAARPPLPSSLADIVLSADLTMTQDGERFLMINDGTTDRILGFYTDDALEILCSASTIYMDGTFKVVPTIFCQLYTLHACYQGQMMPCEYFLLPQKRKETYIRMFRLMQDDAAAKNLVFRPPKFHIDYEAAVLKAIDQCFPAAEVKGCAFHFTQALWRNVQRFGLAEFYKNDMNVRK